jgi:hypothetical protein
MVEVAMVCQRLSVFGGSLPASFESAMMSLRLEAAIAVSTSVSFRKTFQSLGYPCQ